MSSGVAPTVTMLLFAILYFSVMLDCGLFDPVTKFLIRWAKGDPQRLCVAVCLISLVVSLDGDGTTTESHTALSRIMMGVRNPVMLIRIKPQDMHKVVKRQGQESFNFGDLFAYTKVCSHLGCPSSLYEQQTYRILCPCHQSQFDALHFAKPIFGPAARALAQLPLTIDKDGYLVANGDFIEPVGPAFWERKS